MRDAMEKIFCLAPSSSPLIEPVVSRTKTRSIRGRSCWDTGAGGGEGSTFWGGVAWVGAGAALVGEAEGGGTSVSAKAEGRANTERASAAPARGREKVFRVMGGVRGEGPGGSPARGWKLKRTSRPPGLTPVDGKTPTVYRLFNQLMKTSLTTPRKLGLLTSLYLSQGLPFGFFTQALPVLLRERGLSLPAIGLTHLLALPWALKFLWAPWMDRYGSARWGRRRGYILPLQFLSAVLLLALALPEGAVSMTALMGAVLLVNLLAATQDVATDGLAVGLLTPPERGWGTGIQVAGYRVGVILGGGVMLLVFARFGWRPTLLSLGALLLVATVPVALFREPAPAELPRRDTGSPWRWARGAPLPPPPPRRDTGSPWRWLGESLLHWRHRPGVGAWFTLLVLFKAGESLATGMVRTFLVDVGLGLSQVGWMLGFLGFTTGLLGAV